MNNITKFNLNEISEKITKPWSPENIETVNDYVIRIARFDGKYHWHKHDKEDVEEVLEMSRKKI